MTIQGRQSSRYQGFREEIDRQALLQNIRYFANKPFFGVIPLLLIYERCNNSIITKAYRDYEKTGTGADEFNGNVLFRP